MQTPAICGTTQLVGIIGHPLDHSRSPEMHNAAFAALGLDWAYVPFPVHPDQLEPAVRGLAAAGVRGFNVTIPHKTAILPLLDERSPQAEVIGAVNTVVIDNGRLIGHNTDGEGFSRSLHAAHRFKPERSLGFILGAGGAAHAVCDQLAREGIPGLRISNRTQAKAEALAARIRNAHPGCDAKALHWNPLDHRAAINWAELIINTTSVGLKADDPSPLDVNGIGPGHIVADLIYHPTRLIAQCKEIRARTLDGKGMLLHQGAAAFTLWTGQDAPLEVMEQALA